MFLYNNLQHIFCTWTFFLIIPTINTCDTFATLIKFTFDSFIVLYSFSFNCLRRKITSIKGLQDIESNWFWYCLNISIPFVLNMIWWTYFNGFKTCKCVVISPLFNSKSRRGPYFNRIKCYRLMIDHAFVCIMLAFRC